MSSKTTKALVKLVEKSASEPNSWQQAQQLINQGADIKMPTSNGSMIQAVIAEEKRHRLTAETWKADNCLQLTKTLEKAASEQLKNHIFSQSGTNFQEMRLLLNLRASCYQFETYGPLGLLGAILSQDEILIRLDVIKFIVENDSMTRNSLTIITKEKTTCLSLAKSNAKCPKEVIDYIQQQLDELVNQIPLTQPQMNPNQIVLWFQSGANMEAIDKHGNTVLCNAILANNLELVRILVSAGCSTTHKNNDGLTPIDIAKRAFKKNPPLIAFLEGQTVNLDLKKLIEKRKSTLTIDEVQDLLAKGANINGSVTNGDSPLHLLIANQGTLEMIKIFVNDLNADLSLTNTNGYRPIETCIMLDKKPYSYLQTLLSLPKMTTDQFWNTKLNKTILNFAIEQKRPDVEKLIQMELNIRLWNCIARTTSNDDHNKSIIENINQLMTAGAQINHLHIDDEYNQWTVLHLATKISTVKLLRFIVQKLQADHRLANGNGDYPISIACQFGQLSMIEYLRQLPNSTLNIYNNDKQTPLHLAVKNNHFLVVRYLVRWGANDRALNVLKQTPLDMARENVSKSKEEEMSNKKIIQFLEQLVCPSVDKTAETSLTMKKPSMELDVCDLPVSVVLSPIVMPTEDADAAIGKKSGGIFSTTPNTKLHDAARTGDIMLARKSIGDGADIRYRKGNQTPLEVAINSQNEYTTRLRTPNILAVDITRIQTMIAGCHQIAQMIQTIAYTKMTEAIQQSNAGLVMAYHRAGAFITPELLYKACSASDNVEIVDYLLSQHAQLYQILINDNSSNCPYRLAKANKFQKLAAYLKYRLSIECAKAIKENKLDVVKKLVSAGANIDMTTTNNLDEAIKLQNVDLIKFLCDYGAKMPSTWLLSPDIVLDTTLSKQLAPNILEVINTCLIERRFRLAAAMGDYKVVNRCQQLGVNIDSMNCHGSTALVCSIQHGNYFPIVHTLISHGASMLHSNENVRMSLIDLAHEQDFKQIAAYLSKELNVQFMTAILNNDRSSAERFSQLGCDFNYQDEQQRTPLHYAVQYHGADLVTWLCEGGSVPTINDVNGDYPIMLAIEKGDYTVVELFVTKYPATKQQVNKTGMTALQIAQKLKFNRIVQLIEKGKGGLESEADRTSKTDEPKYSEENLIQAAHNGHIKIIREFIAQRYESKEEKKSICQRMIQAAKKALQYEIIDVLEPYYKTELRTELASDMHAGSNIVLTERYKKILFGVLGSLNNMIGESSVVLDPADPNTYTQLFTGLTQSISKRSKELEEVRNTKDVEKLVQQDQKDTNEQINKIHEKLEELLESRDDLQARVLDTDQRLFKEQKLTALQRKEFMKEKELHEQQLATYECSIFLFQRQQEAITNRQKALEFLKKNSNLILFYRTIENRLEALFHSYLAAQGGYVKIEQTTNYGKGVKLLDKITKIPDKIPIVNLVVGITKGILGPILSKLDEKQQKREWYNISTLGNIEELRRIASETAGLVTLYYNEQIQSIDTSQKIKGSNIFNDQVHWLKQIYNVRPENAEELVVVIVAEYVTAWIIDGLKVGTEITLTEPLSQQLWLHVAKKDPINMGKRNKATDLIGLTVGQQQIPLIVKNSYGKKKSITVQLRYLIGCVSVIGNDGSIYQYPVPEDNADPELIDLDNFGYVYVKPFSSDEKDLQIIVDGRQLHLAKRDDQGNILTRFQDILEHAQTFISHQEQSTSKSLITKETANTVAEVLRENKIFVDPNVLKDELRVMQEKIEVSIDVLREQLEQKTNYYQVSIDAAHEQIVTESQQNRDTMEKDNRRHYDQTLKKLNQYAEKATNDLQELIKKRLDEIEIQLAKETKNILAIVQAAKAESAAAMVQAQQANENSHQAIGSSEKASKSAETLVQWAQQRSDEYQRSINTCEERIKQTALMQKQKDEQIIMEIRAKAEQDMSRSREAVTKSVADAKVTAQSAQESERTTKGIQTMMKTLVESHKTDMKKLIVEAQDIRKDSERVTKEAKEVHKQATRAADTTTATMEKVNAMQAKIEKALRDIDKVLKKLPASVTKGLDVPTSPDKTQPAQQTEF